MKKYSIAIVGATGAVGAEVLKTLESRKLPISEIRLLASKRSLGKTLPFCGEECQVKELTSEAFEGIDFAIFSAGATRSKEFAPAAVKAGAVVIDNSSAFRMRDDVPLVVPEVNPSDLKNHQGIVANPNCTAAILSVVAWPLHQAAGIQRMIISTYQSASGAGAKAMEELENQSRQFTQNLPITKEIFPHQIAFNVFSHNTPLAENGYNDEENKVCEEIQKMFHAPDLKLGVTCIRVPVLRAHSESVTIETEKKLSAIEAREILEKAPGVQVLDSDGHFPMPIEASGKLDVLVGRIREDISHPRSLSFFVSGDQLLKGAAWNAVQILETLIAQR